MTYIVDDSRVFDARPVREVARWLVANDKFLSGWGHAPRRSLVAYPADAMSLKRLDELYEWCDERSDFVRVRVQERLPRLRDGDHLSIYDVPSRFTEPEPVPEPWTMFIDMCSGGEWRSRFLEYLIQAPPDVAEIVFRNRFRMNPHKKTCDCSMCGEDFKVIHADTLEELVERSKWFGTVPHEEYMSQERVCIVYTEDIEDNERVAREEWR